MRSAKNFFRAIFLLLPFLFLTTATTSAFAVAADDDENADDYAPPVTTRVARISLARGDVQIRRAGETDWERAAQNLPVVEGDEITTDADARLEIQFDSRTFLRLAENSYLKITTLRDEGVAVSLPEGSLSARVLEFDKGDKYFEIDAPKTTVAVERAGMYRVDAGSERGKSSEVRASVTDGGEARIYSETSGFTLRNGRSARINLEGNYAGEWETTDAARYADDFDAWALERDSIIAKRLQTAAYDKYYDRDTYGAEDLGDYGEWIYTKRYGYVWRPYGNATSAYADWSPYRYGQWRWLPDYGWTWVNDEPWGWATYHHGRWIYVDDRWAWTPYGKHRWRRNWWQPAFVVVSYVGAQICWYPLPYEYNYYNYNSYYIDRRRTTIINNTTVVVNPTPAPPVLEGGGALGNPGFRRKPPIENVPPTGVVAVDASEFGRGGARNFRRLPIETAKNVLAKPPAERGAAETAALPTFKDLNGRFSREIAVEKPIIERINPPVREQIGASERGRVIGKSMDETLRNERVFGGRPPVERTPPANETRGSGNGDAEKNAPRETGAVRRLPRSETVRGDNNGGSETETRGGGGRPPENDDERKVIKPRNENRGREQSPPVYAPPPQQQQQTEEPQQRGRDRERRQEPPQQQQPQERREERRQEPPQRQPAPPAPRAEPKPVQREEKPPQQQERKSEPTRQKEPPVDKDNR